LIPLYFFTLLFFWRIMLLFGGGGPLFFNYEKNHNCSDTWMWHALFVNNLIPWRKLDGCMTWTWYLACDIQFFLLLPFLVQTYKADRSMFWKICFVLFAFCQVFTTIVIFKNDFSANFFTYQQDFWTLLHYKPYTRFPSFLIGIIWGCSYFDYKTTFRKPSSLDQVQTQAEIK